MGIQGIALPPDPIQEQPTYEGALAAIGSPALDPRPLRQRRRRLAREALSGLRAVLLWVPRSRHPGPGLVPRAQGRPARSAARRGARRRLHLDPAHGEEDRLHGRRRLGRRRPLDRHAGIPLGAESARLCGLLPDRPAGAEHDRDRRRRRAALGPLLDPQRRPAGDDQRGSARRGGDLRPERLGARQRAQARRAEEHPAAAGPQPAQVRRRAVPARALRQGHDPLYYEGHAYRAGSRIRVTIAAPGGSQPIWAFADSRPKGKAKVAIAYSKKMPSKLLLPVVPGVEVPTALPPCPGLRGEPCRAYRPFANRAARPWR